MKTCGLDVHKDMIFCAIYNGKDSVVKQFSSFTPDLRDMCGYIKGEGVTTVAMESTGIYIEAIRTVLRQSGMKAVVVNPFLIKQMPGRKSDVKDAEWIAKLHHKQMLSESFVPDGTLAELRAYTREHRKLTQRRTQVLTKIDRLLVAGGIRLSSCVSSLDTKGFLKVARAVAGGDTDPERLEKMVQGCTKHKRDGTLRKALTGCMERHHMWRIAVAMEELDLYDRLIAEAKDKMEGLTEAHYHEEARLLQTIPGVGRLGAISIIAEIGTDMGLFGSGGRLAGWAGLRPRNDESAGKCKSTAITKGGAHLKPILVQCAWSAVRVRDSKFQQCFTRLCVRKSAKKAIVAIARKLLVTAYALLLNHEEYSPNKAGDGVTPEQLHRRIQYHIAQTERLRRRMTLASRMTAPNSNNTTIA